jgi:hypothetical protein
MYKQRIAIFSFLICLSATAYNQQFSMATDIDLQRSFKKEQRYWAVGQALQAHFHLTSKDGIYVWVSYYSNGKFNNKLQAIAKSALTVPAQINYTNAALMKFKHISTGWKKYLKGAANAEDKWNLYAYAGFGLLLGRIENKHSVIVDTAKYQVPVFAGKANFKRLTFDLGLGWEIPMTGDIYFYIEGRTWLPTTDYPSKYIFVNENAPLAGMLSAGFRVFFE